MKWFSAETTEPSEDTMILYNDQPQYLNHWQGTIFCYILDPSCRGHAAQTPLQINHTPHGTGTPSWHQSLSRTMHKTTQEQPEVHDKELASEFPWYMSDLSDVPEKMTIHGVLLAWGALLGWEQCLNGFYWSKNRHMTTRTTAFPTTV